MVLNPSGTEDQSHGTLYPTILNALNHCFNLRKKLKYGSPQVAHAGSAKHIFPTQVFYNSFLVLNSVWLYCILMGDGRDFVHMDGWVSFGGLFLDIYTCIYIFFLFNIYYLLFMFIDFLLILIRTCTFIYLTFSFLYLHGTILTLST